MQTNNLFIPIAVLMMAMTIGCGGNDNQQIVEITERSLDREAQQNRQLSELQRQVRV